LAIFCEASLVFGKVGYLGLGRCLFFLENPGESLGARCTKVVKAPRSSLGRRIWSELGSNSGFLGSVLRGRPVPGKEDWRGLSKVSWLGVGEGGGFTFSCKIV
jgi:hypothetical protein